MRKGELAMAMPIPPAHSCPDNSCPDTDVLVIGHGPVAQVLSILLAQRGWLTTLADPVAVSPTYPQVVGLNEQTMRVLASCGIGSVLDLIGIPGTELEFSGAVLRFHRGPGVTMFHHSALTSVLDSRAAQLPNLQILRGRSTALLVDHGRYAEAVTGGETLTSSWVIDCDGRHSVHGHPGSRRSGRILLPPPGDISDAATLTWKLDLVLRNRAHDALLDGFDADGPLLPPATVQTANEHGPFDSVLGPGFALLARSDVRPLLGAARRAFLDDINTKVVHLLPAGTAADAHTAVDTENVYLPFLARFDAAAALIRPDHHVFGFAHGDDELLDLVDDLRTQLFHPRMRPRPIE
ncbi:FAD-dependent monooxygenase [Lentzea alba]|uniref:FAD-dependent monooxygenase n=1 Tax=Lentzea alba TaxID=2714351 RepID=UPI0039BF434E